MASSYSTDLKLELMVTGENSGTWGDKTNTNLNLLQQAIAGYQSIALTSTNTTLVMTDATISNARNAVIEFTGAITANATVFVASGIEKTYTIKNSTTGAFTLALNQVGGASVIFGATEKNIKGVYLDGTNANTIDLSTLGGTINSSASLADFVVGSNELDTASVTSVKIASSAVTSTKIASFAVTSGALDTASVTSVKIASGAVGTTQLAATGVTAATYTAATITVGADGRITSASAGSGGAGMGIPTLTALGPASGTFTAGPSTNRLAIYAFAGGGGGAGTGYIGVGSGGGTGGYGFYNVPIVQPYSAPYAAGGAGGGGAYGGGQSGTPGSAGGNTNFGPTIAITAGNGGLTGYSGAGNPGSAPTATLIPPNRSFVVGLTPSTTAFGIAGNPGFARADMEGGQAGNPGNPGTSGGIFVFENSGT